MKKLFVPSMLVSLVMVCSCQKQDSTAEQQLAQRKAELDARELALNEREKALAERQKVVAKPRIAPAPRTVPVPRMAPVPRTAPAQPQQTIPADFQDLVGKMEELQKRRIPASRRSQATVPPTEEAASPNPSSTPE
jgi:hypothetical protein